MVSSLVQKISIKLKKIQRRATKLLLSLRNKLYTYKFTDLRLNNKCDTSDLTLTIFSISIDIMIVVRPYWQTGYHKSHLAVNQTVNFAGFSLAYWVSPCGDLTLNTPLGRFYRYTTVIKIKGDHTAFITDFFYIQKYRQNTTIFLPYPIHKSKNNHSLKTSCAIP